MKKLSTLVALSALAFAFAAPPSFAQNAAAAATEHSMSASKLIGTPVYNEQGDKIGAITDILVRDTASEPTAVLSVGDYVGNGAKLVAVPLDHVTFKGKQPMMAGATRQVLAAMPAFTAAGGAGGAG